MSTNELIELICNVTGRKAHLWRIPCGMMDGMARIGDWLRLPLNRERLRKLTENYVSSNRKVRNALGVEHLPVKAKDGLIKTIESFEKK